MVRISLQRISIGLYEDTHDHSDACTADVTTVLSRVATRFAQLSQKRAFSQGTSAQPSRGATKQTSKHSRLLRLLHCRCRFRCQRSSE